jgi:micrococcal nuclease
VRLVGDAEQRDRYGRVLAYVYREPDGAFVNAQLVRDGYARTLTIAPNVAHARELADLARAARQAHRGLWSAC